jgi:hypothetical protein
MDLVDFRRTVIVELHKIALMEVDVGLQGAWLSLPAGGRATFHRQGAFT